MLNCACIGERWSRGSKERSGSLNTDMAYAAGLSRTSTASRSSALSSCSAMYLAKVCAGAWV